MITLHACGPLHAEVVAGLQGVCFDSGWSADETRSLLVMPGAFALIAVDGDEESRPMGFAVCRVAADECEVLSIGVPAEHRRTGIGRRLLDAASTHAAGMGAVRLFLEVALDNPAGLAFYRARGFRQVGRRRNYYRRAADRMVDALILTLDMS